MEETAWLDPGVAAHRQRWMALLGRCRHDFHHLPDYVELEARRLGGRAGALLVGGAESRAALLPLILRPLDELAAGSSGAMFDASSPYGYPGPLFVDADPAFMDAAVDELVSALRERGVVTAFVRLHPLLDAPMQALARAGELVDHGPTVWIDLQADEATQWGDYRGTHRNLIRRATREGMRVCFDDAFARLDEFFEVYAQTMVRLDADWAELGRDYLQELAAVLRGRGSLALVEHDGQVIAGGLFSSCCGLVQYHLSGTASAWLRVSPSRLMIDEARRRHAARGDWRMHLGGGVGANEDALFRFKRGFSSARGRFVSWRVIADPHAYAGLVAAWEARGGSREQAGGFFPRYRAPI